MDALVDSPTRVYGTYDLISKDKQALEGRETQLREERNALVDTLPLDEKKIGDVVVDVSMQGKTAQVYARVVELINDKTNAFREYEEAGIRQALLWDLADAQLGGRSIKWRYKLPEDTGRYHHVRGEIQIDADVSSKQGILFSLAKQGTLSLPARAAAHEYTHSLQVPPSRKRTISHPELHEAQALRMGYEGIGRFSAEELVDLVLKSGDYSNFTRPKLLYAVEAMDKLSALKTPLWEVIKLVRGPGKWDEKKGHYERIQSALERKIRQKGLGQEGFEKLVLCFALEAQIQHLKVMHIVQTELKNAAIPYAA